MAAIRSLLLGFISILLGLFAAEGSLQPAACWGDVDREAADDPFASSNRGAPHDAGVDTVAADFFSWDLGEDSLMHALFPDLDQLRDAWEDHPLLSKVSFNEDRISRRREGAPMDAIPTLFHNRTALFKYGAGADPLLSMFSVDDAMEVLKQVIHTTHGSDYSVMKKVEINGQEYRGQLKQRTYTLEEVANYFHDKGMSIVINWLQQRWHSVAAVALRMEEELMAQKVNANVYLTSQVYLDEKNVKENGMVRQGLAAHWDPHDVFIVQLAGGKRWSVARNPVIFLSNKEKHREPTQDEVEHYAQKDRFREFTLCPGDILYIPRGHIHNASTIVFEDLSRKWTDWDDCPNYPEGSAEAEELANRLAMPSMHITFGPSSDLTIEALLHYALHDYFEGDRGATKNRVVIPAGTCSNPDEYQKAMDHDIDWHLVLHHALAGVARTEHECNNPSFRGVPAKKGRRCDAILRKSAPLLQLSNTSFHEHNDARAGIRRNLEKAYVKALDLLRSSASVSKTIDFIRTDLLQPCPYFQCLGEFSFPGYDKERHAILCPSELNAGSIEDEFRTVLQDFVEFVRADFAPALRRMNRKGRESRIVYRQDQQRNLERVGQEGIEQ